MRSVLHLEISRKLIVKSLVTAIFFGGFIFFVSSANATIVVQQLDNTVITDFDYDGGNFTQRLSLDPNEFQGSFNRIELKIFSQDGGGSSHSLYAPIIILSKNVLNYEWAIDKKEDELRILNQQFFLKNQLKVHAIFKQKKNETKIKIMERTKKDKQKSEETLPGLHILELATRSGELDFEIK